MEIELEDIQPHTYTCHFTHTHAGRKRVAIAFPANWQRNFAWRPQQSKQHQHLTHWRTAVPKHMDRPGPIPFANPQSHPQSHILNPQSHCETPNEIRRSHLASLLIRKRESFVATFFPTINPISLAQMFSILPDRARRYSRYSTFPMLTLFAL